MNCIKGRWESGIVTEGVQNISKENPDYTFSEWKQDGGYPEDYGDGLWDTYIDEMELQRDEE